MRSEQFQYFKMKDGMKFENNKKKKEKMLSKIKIKKM